MKPGDNRVVITGIGPVTAIGTGRETFWKNLLEGKAVIQHIPPEFEAHQSFKSKFYVPFPETSIQDYGLPGKFQSLMEGSTSAAVVAARLALEDAGIWPKEGDIHLPVNPEKISIILGTGICSLKAGFEAYAANTLNTSVRFNRMVIPMIMPDSATSWISILTGIKGENHTLNASCASGTVAVGEAYRLLQEGRAEMVLAGGFECLKDESGTVMRGFDGLGTLTTSPDGYPRPFSASRSGFLFGEGGACILVLELLDGALKRGAEPYAEIKGYSCNSDAYNIVQMEPSGTRVQVLLEELTTDIKIDYFNSHGTGTVLNDEIEAQVIRKLYGPRELQPVINSTKSIIGHTIGASGAIEAAVTALSVKYGVVHMTLSDDIPDNLNLALENIRHDIAYAVSASYGFGGHNAAILMKKAE